jgi:hypothetical protein
VNAGVNDCLLDFNFTAGVESNVSMLGLSMMSRMSTWGLVRDWTGWSSALLQLNSLLRSLSATCEGSDGGMMVRMEMNNRNMRCLDRVTWGICASEQTGPEVPCTPAVILTRKFLSRSEGVAPGARPCVGAFTLEEFSRCVDEEGIDLQQYVHSEYVSLPSNPGGGAGIVHTNADEQVSPIRQTMEWSSQKMMSPFLRRMLETSDVVTGKIQFLRPPSSVSVMIRGLSKLVLGHPQMTRSDEVFDVVMSSTPTTWTRSIDQGESALTRRSSFSACLHRNLLIEHTSAVLTWQFVQKRTIQPHHSGFEMVCKSAMAFGFIPLPLTFNRKIIEHPDGLGWDIVEVLANRNREVIASSKGTYRVALPEQLTVASMRSLIAVTYGPRCRGVPLEIIPKDWKKVNTSYVVLKCVVLLVLTFSLSLLSSDNGQDCADI